MMNHGFSDDTRLAREEIAKALVAHVAAGPTEVDCDDERRGYRYVVRCPGKALRTITVCDGLFTVQPAPAFTRRDVEDRMVEEVSREISGWEGELPLLSFGAASPARFCVSVPWTTREDVKRCLIGLLARMVCGLPSLE